MKTPERSLPDKLDIITIVDFVWDFLGRSVSQYRTCFPERDPKEHQGEDPVGGLEFYSLNTLIFARPPHIIELLLAAWDSPRRGLRPRRVPSPPLVFRYWDKDLPDATTNIGYHTNKYLVGYGIR
jgi:hypothetical protein